MSQVSTGAETSVPIAAPPICRAEGSPRRSGGNHLYSACIDIEAAGPSATPSRTRPAIRVGTAATASTGSWATAHSSAITKSMVLLETREEKKPTTSPERLNSR